MIEASKVLANIPNTLRDPLVEEYKGIVSAHSEGRWKLTSLDGGRFCEVAYTILEGAISGTFASAPIKPARFVDACKALESKPPISCGDRSLRILIPRILPAVYEIRNNRNVGHVGGDVVSNKMDASFVHQSATWVTAELIRVFHGVSTTEAQETVDALVERRSPLVWEIDGVRRVLAPNMTASERTLVLLYVTPGWVDIKKLKEWTKYKANFLPQVLRPLATKLMIELNSKQTMAIITPLGSKAAEEKLNGFQH